MIHDEQNGERASTIYDSNLVADDIFAINRAFIAGDNMEEVAAAYEVDVSVVHSIVRPTKICPTAGEGNYRARLTEKEVLEIRENCATGTPYAAVATAYGIGAEHVCRINLRQLWQHLPPDEDAPDPRRNVLLSTEQVLEVRKRYAAGDRVGALAKAYGVHHSTISLIVHRKSHTHLK